MMLGADLTIDTVEHILAGDLCPIPQDELIADIEPTPAPKIFKDTCHIDWTQPAEQIHNLVRGLSPYPAAWITLHRENEELTAKVFTTAVVDTAANDDAGTIKVDGDKLYIAAADHMVEIKELQLAGKRRMTAAEFLRGFNPALYRAK